MKRIGPAPSMRAASTSSSGHREEELAEQEGRRRRGDQRHRQAGVGVEHAEQGDDLVGRPDAHLHRQHQRDEDQPEHGAAERKAEIDDGESRHRNRRSCPSGMIIAVTKLTHHRRGAGDLAAAGAIAAEQRRLVGFQVVPGSSDIRIAWLISSPSASRRRSSGKAGRRQ